MKKRVLAAVLAAAVLAGLLGGCGNGTSGYVTRGEWVKMLGTAFGLDTPRSDDPVYSDVAAGDPIFPYVQSTAQWKVLTVFDGDELRPDKPVTGREVAATAAVAAGFYGHNADEAVAYAQQYGIVSGRLSDKMTAEECAAVLDAAKSVYVENPGEDKRVAVFAPGVVDLRGLGPEWISAGEDSLTVYTTAALDGSTATLTVDGRSVSISVGSVVLAMGPGSFSVERAYKITDIRDEGGQVTFLAAQPEFSEIYDELDIHTTLSLQDDGYIAWEEGVTATPITPSELSASGQSYHVELLVNQPKDLKPKNEDDARIRETWGFEFGDGVKLLHNDAVSPVLGNSAQAKLFNSSGFSYTDTPSLADFGDDQKGFEWDLERTEKYDTGYKLTGDISFDLSATTDVDYKKLNILDEEINLWPEQASVSLDSNITARLRYEGNWSKDVKLATLTIPIPGTGLSVKGSLFLCLGISGAIEVKLVLEDTVRAEWTQESGYREGEGKHTATPKVTGAVDLSVGGKIAVDLCACNISLIGASLKIEGILEAEGKLVGECESITANGAPALRYAEKLRLSSNLYLPIVSLTVTGPECVSDIFGLEATFTLIDKDEEHPIPVFASDWTIWETTVGEDGQVLEEEFPGLKVDISSYVGTYQPFTTYEGETATALTLAEDGSITGEAGYAWPGGSFSEPLVGSGVVPIRMLENDDGSITCVLDDGGESTAEEEEEEFSTEISTTYIIYPPGIPTGNSATASLDGTTRIYYENAGGGVEYHWYYQTPHPELAASSFDELWDMLAGTWQFEEYRHLGKPTLYADHTIEIEFGYDGGTPCMRRNSRQDDVRLAGEKFYELVAVDPLSYNAYTYKRGFYETEGSNWGDEVQSAWYSFDLSELERGTLIMGYHVIFTDGYVDNDHIFRYSLVQGQ